MTFKRNKYKSLHLGFKKKITYVSTAWKGSGEKERGWGWGWLAAGLMSSQCDTASQVFM